MKLPSPILSFMLASAGIHAGLAMTSFNSTDITLPGSTGSVMVVRIVGKTTKQHHKNKPENISRKKSPAKLTKLISPGKYKKNQEQRQIDDKTLTPTTSQVDNSRTQVVSILIDEFSQYFTYPKLAQKRNWQGKVSLSLRITSSGKIKNIQLNNSSGYDILDQAAINSLSKVEQLPGISTRLPFDFELEFPVIYKLIEG